MKNPLHNIHLETERLVLREWELRDRPLFAQMNADPMVMEHFPRRLDEKASGHLVERFQKHFKLHGFGMYAVDLKATNSFIGFVGLEHVESKFPFAPAVEVAWRIDYGQWGKGYATEAARAVLDHGFKKLGLKEIVAFGVHDNKRAISVMENIGMKRDEKADFDYPSLRKDHPLGKFVLYRANKNSLKK
jgi:RimJ/RimL family protein N-acetyltransferase